MKRFRFTKLVGYKLTAIIVAVAAMLLLAPSLSARLTPAQTTSSSVTVPIAKPVFTTAASTSSPIDSLNPGEWYMVPNSNLSTVLPSPVPPGNSGPAAIMTAWNSAAYDTLRDRLLVWGGGHTDYCGNEMYAFDINSLSWSRIWGPSTNIPLTGTFEAYPDGNPAARHTYDGLAYIPGLDKFFTANGSHCWGGGGGTGTWLFNLANSTWTQAHDTLAGEVSVVAVYDPVTQHVFHQGNVIFSEYDPVANTYTQRGSITAGLFSSPTGAIDPVRRLFVMVGPGKVRVWNLNTWQYSEPTTRGGAPVLNSTAPGLKYDPIRQTFIAWVGGATVYELDPSTWNWTTRGPAPTNTVIPTNPPANGTFSRFQYIPSKNAYIAVNSIFQNVYIYKVSSATDPQVTSFKLTSGTTGTVPFSVGLGFRKGDIPGVPTLDVSTAQVVVKSRWSDNSVKHAVASGRVGLTASTPVTVNVFSSAAAPAGTNLTAADIQAANPSASVQLGSYGTVTLSSLLATPFRTWISGPEMVEAHYRSAVGSDPSLVVWFHVRLYKGGQIWIRTSVENGYLDVATTNKVYVPTVTVNGVVVYSNGGASLSHYAHTRWTIESWVGTDPQVTPTMDTLYLIDSKLVPNYWKRNPSATALNGLYQNYVPMQNGGWTPTMGDTGFAPQIGLLPLWDSLFITSGGDSRAFNSVLANAKAINSYAIVWNDSATSLPTTPSGRPTWTVEGPNGAGDTSWGAGTLVWDFAHHGSAGYLAYLITGDYYYLETMQDQSSMCYLMNSSVNGLGTSRQMLGQTRGVAWCQRTVGEFAGIAPPDSISNDYRSLLANNATYWKNQMQKPGQNPLGYLYSYEMGSYPTPGAVAPWQQHFWVQTYGHVSDLEPLADMTTWNSVRDYLYKSVVGILGPSGTTNFCYNSASSYNITVAPTNSFDPTTWYTSWGTVYQSTFGVPNTSCGSALLGASGGDPAAAPTGYWGNLLPAIAYAVDQGASGASDSWTRLINASNWSTLANSGFDDTPLWGIVPRTAPSSPPPPDLTPPTISNLSASSITSSTATITWTTDKASDSQVLYGLTSSLGIQTTLATSLVTSHSVTLSNLLGGTVYYYTVKSRDSSGNLGTTNTLTFTTAVDAGTTNSALTNGLIGYWPLNEGSGTTTADLSGNNNAGTLINGPVWITGKVGNALQFNATDGDSNDTDDPRIWVGRNFDIPALPFTISAWVNPTDFTDYRGIISKRDSAASASMRFDMGLEQTSGKVYVGSPAHLTFDYLVPKVTWTHIVVVATATNTMLYINGNLQQTIGVFTLGTRATANTAIGGTGEPLNGDDDPFKGAIDEVRVYNRSLSPSEIQLAFNSTPPVISGVGASNITLSTATITWTTDLRADSQVDYGTTAAYGQSTTLDASLVNAHSVNLSGLSAGTTYHYRVKSSDAARNLAIVQDFTFTTAPPPVITLSPATLPGAIVGVAYTQTITASGGSSPYTFTVTLGSLPAGLALNASTGTISGTPTTVGAAIFTVQALDSMGYPGSLAYTVNTSNLASNNVNLAYTGRTYDGSTSASPPLVGRLTLNFDMTNIGPAITSPMYFKVTDLYKLFPDQDPTLPNLLLSADNHAGKAGDTQTLPITSLAQNQTVPVTFLVGIGTRQTFELYIDLYTGPSQTPMTANAILPADTGTVKAAFPATSAATLLGRFKFTVSEDTPVPTGNRLGPFTGVPPPAPNGGAPNLGVITGAKAQSRPAAAVDPILPAHMAVASNDYGASAVKVSTTTDGGATWNTITLSRTLGSQTFFGAQDPSIAYDSGGRLSVVYSLSNLNDSSNAIVVSESTDGINFNPPYALSSHPSSDRVIDSRPVIAIKPGAGRYVAWDSLSLATFRYSINVTRSEEGGVFGPVTTVASEDRVSSPALAVNKNFVYIGWDNWGFNSASPYNGGGRLVITSAPNTAQLNFAAPQEIARTAIGFGQTIPAMPERGVGPNLGLATDPKDDSRIYAAFVDKGNGMDIRLAGSADRGQTWQALTVNNDGTAADQFDPAIAVDSDSNVYVSFYDTRLSSTFEAADVFLARPSTSNGFDNQRITTVSSNDSRQNAGRDFTANLGEHTALAITSGNVLVAWTDTRQNSEDIFVSMVTGTQHQVAVPKITWNIPPPITYGTPLGTAQLNASASVPGTFVYTPPPGTFPGAGTQTLAVTFTPSDTANFTTATASVQLTVVPAELTVTAISVSRFYGSPNPLLTGTTSGIVNGDNIVAAFTVNATVSSAPGTYTVIPVLSDPDKRLINYSVTLKTGIFEIRPAPLTVTANSASRLYASGNPALTGSIAGLVNGDNITATYTTTATTKSIVGKYPITAVISDGNKRLSNYTLTQIDGALEVVPAPLSVTANSASRFYGSANPVFTGLITGVVNSDNITAGYTTVATANSMPGTYPISPFMIDPDQRLSNYKVMATNGALTVIPAPIITLSATKPGSASAGNVQVSFGDQDLFSTSKSVTVTVGNIGTADLLISGLAVTGDGASEFALTNACAKTVAAGSNCIFTLRFTPSALGRRAAVITLTDNTGGYEGSRQTVNTSGNGVLTYAAYATDTGCAAISFSGNASTDSFDSSHGTYAETKSNQRGDVAVNGNITLSGNATVNGTAYAVNAAAGPCKDGNPGISVSGKAAATGGYRPLPGPISFTTPAAVVPGRAAVRIKNDMALPPGKYGDITVERGAKLILSAGSYDVNSLNLNGASITVAGDGQVVLNIAGIDTDDNPIELSSKTRINPSGNPANFLVKYGGRAQIDLGGQLEFYGILYAPNAAVKLGGDADWYGAMVVDSLESSGTGALHYDRNLSVGFDSK